MYFYPDNLLESILVFQNGKFNYKFIPESVREASRISIPDFQTNCWYMTLLRERRFLTLLLAAGTTLEVARSPGRNSASVEIIEELLHIIREKVGFLDDGASGDTFQQIVRQSVDE